MNNEQINAAIAIECGWTHISGNVGLPPMFIHRENSWALPDYCADLNAMHEAEKVLTDNDWDLYCFELGYSLRGCASATARQRAEAFLRTLGKWEEVQE